MENYTIQIDNYTIQMENYQIQMEKIKYCNVQHAIENTRVIISVTCITRCIRTPRRPKNKVKEKTGIGW
jgi:hypothetical protein